MLTFSQWVEQNAGAVDQANLTNVAADDGFKRLRSKWQAGNLPQREKECDADKLFGKKKKQKSK